MTFLLLGPALLYVLAASWALKRGGARALWTVAVAAAVAFVAAGVGVGLWYAVPSLPMLLLYVALLFGPMVLTTALALAPAGMRAAPLGRVVAIASAGAVAGLVIGVFAAVYGMSFVAY